MPEFTFRLSSGISEDSPGLRRLSGRVKALLCLLSLLLPLAGPGGEARAQSRPAQEEARAQSRPQAILAQPRPVDAPAYSIAWHYGEKPPLSALRMFDRVVVDPDHDIDPKAYLEKSKGQSELYAYVAIGEVLKSRSYFPLMPVSMVRGENQAWSSLVIDQTHPDWPEFFVEKIITPYWNRGYQGFFLDTMDSYHLIAKDDAGRQAQQQGLIRAIRLMKTKFPQARLVFNRGFELLGETRPLVEAVAAESLLQAWDNSTKLYKPVAEADHQWLLDRLREVRQMGLPAIAIDYVDPKDMPLARQTANKILDLGITPYVSDGLLSTIGRGAWEITPRRVLLLHDTTVNKDAHFSSAQRFLVLPLQYLGYRVDMIDLRTEKVPQGHLADQYAAVVVQMSSSETLKKFKLAPFISEAKAQGMKLVFFEGLGEILEGKLASELGLAPVRAKLQGPYSLQRSGLALNSFEIEATPKPSGGTPFRLTGAGEVLLSVKDSKGERFDAVGITPWGGWALMSQVFSILKDGELTRWTIDPILFLEKALNAPNFPVPDVTTEAGRRLLMVHIDGDGFASRAEIPKVPFAAEVMQKDFIERYRVPHTVSVIQGEVAANGMYPAFSPALEKIARDIFALSNVEIASHSYSHPFYWNRAVAEGDNPKLRLPIPNYKVDLDYEIGGSASYINTRLAPPGKRTRVFLWTGDCVPTADAISTTYKHQLYNMNGGDTMISKSQPSLTMVAPMSVRKAGWLQIYAPMQNENVYTNDWTGPFYGFTRLIETLELTDKPRRLKPVNIYYHTYSASKPASIEALHKVYRYALAQPHTAIYGSEYIEKVLDWEDLVIARNIRQSDPLDNRQQWQLSGDGSVRSFRMRSATTVNLAESHQVAGSTALHDGLYLHTSNARSLVSIGGAIRLASLDVARASDIGAISKNLFTGEDLFTGASPLQVREANGSISALSRSASGLAFQFQSHSAGELRLDHPSQCTVQGNGKTLSARKANPSLPPGTHEYHLGKQDQPTLVSVNC